MVNSDSLIAAITSLVESSISYYPARTRRNIEKSDGTVIFSLERALSGETRLTLELANKLGKPVLRIMTHAKSEDRTQIR